MSSADAAPLPTSVCALEGCGQTVAQPVGGGRRRLYCSNAHRAEGRRRRLAGAPEPAPADALGSALDRLAGVLDELRRHEATLRSIDPDNHALELARLRAAATADVLAAQQSAASSAEEVGRLGQRLATMREEGEQVRTAAAAESDTLRKSEAAATEAAAAAQKALAGALAAHMVEVEARDQAAARAAAAHEQETTILSDKLDQGRTALATAQARAEAADLRAGAANDAACQAAARAADLETSLEHLRHAVASAEATATASAVRADAAERLVDQLRTDLQAERSRHDVSLAGLHDQLAELVARKPQRRAGTTPSSPKRPKPASDTAPEGRSGEITRRDGPSIAARPSPKAPAAPGAGTRPRP